jgi:nuclear transport factor 2 (NTF2) superfamily protein
VSKVALAYTVDSYWLNRQSSCRAGRRLPFLKSNENREFDEKRPMHRRFASINDAPILEVAAFLTD